MVFSILLVFFERVKVEVSINSRLFVMIGVILGFLVNLRLIFFFVFMNGGRCFIFDFFFLKDFVCN